MTLSLASEEIIAALRAHLSLVEASNAVHHARIGELIGELDEANMLAEERRAECIMREQCLVDALRECNETRALAEKCKEAAQESDKRCGELVEELDEARKLAEHYRDNGIGAFVQGRLPWEEK